MNAAGRPGAPRSGPGYVVPRNRSLVRALALLEQLGADGGGRSVAALVRATGLPRATVTRTLATLADQGFAARRGDGLRWTLGPAIARLATRSSGPADVVSLALPLLRGVVEATGESAMLGLPTGPLSAEVVHQVDAGRLVRIGDWVGRSFPLHASAFGKLLLARLDDAGLERELRRQPLRSYTARTRTAPEQIAAEVRRVRRAGYAETADDYEDGLSGIAVPVVAHGWLAAILGVGGPSSRLPPARRRELVAPLRQAADDLERRLRLDAGAEAPRR